MPNSDRPANPPERMPTPGRKRPARAQPLAIMDIDGGLMTLETVMDATGVRKTKIYSMMKAGTFPERVYVAGRSVRWRSEEIRIWISRRGGRNGHG